MNDCIHHGGTEDCPTCECGCGTITDLHKSTATRDGAIKGEHKRFATGHSNRRGRKRKTRIDPDTLLNDLLTKALASGAKGDDLVKVFLDSDELAAAIVMVHAQKALEGNIQSTDFLFKRGLGTAVKKTSNAGKIDLESLFGSDDEDDLYGE